MRKLSKFGFQGCLFLCLLLSFASPTAFAAETPETSQEQLASPSIPQSALLAWAERAVELSLSYDYNSYQQNLKNAAHYFTPASWKEFNSALEKSKNIAEIINRKLSIKVTPTSGSKIVDQGLSQGSFTWKISVPIQRVLAGATQSKVQSGVVTLHVSKVTKDQNPQGLAIVSFSSEFK